MQVTITDHGDLKRLAADLRRLGDGTALVRELAKGIRTELRPAVAAVKAAYLAGPSGRGKARRKGGSLRGALARATRSEVRTGGRQAGVRIRVDGRRMPGGMKALPRYYEGEGRWRHPVFGNRDAWVTQSPHPTFYRTVRPFVPKAQRGVERVAEELRQKILRSR